MKEQQTNKFKVMDCLCCCAYIYLCKIKYYFNPSEKCWDVFCHRPNYFLFSLSFVPLKVLIFYSNVRNPFWLIDLPYDINGSCRELKWLEREREIDATPVSLTFPGWTAALVYCCQEDFLSFLGKSEETEMWNIRNKRGVWKHNTTVAGLDLLPVSFLWCFHNIKCTRRNNNAWH